MNFKNISSKKSKTNKFRIVEEGDNYGLNFMLTHDEKMPMIEFYSDDYFISRYYLDTFLEVKDGLCLDGGAREYDLPGEDIQKIKNSLK